MRVRVLLFGAEAAAVGASVAEVELEGERTCQDLKGALGRGYPALAPFLPGGRVAVNSEFAATNRVIGPGDEVALIGMVSGG